ncbi:MAG: UbiA family prenyltransferase [Candidatus Woykebacteria bacterium]
MWGGVILSFFLGIVGVAVATIVAVLVIAYSSVKRRSGLAGNVLTSVLCSVALTSGIVTNPPAERLVTIVLAGVLLSLLLFSREIVKDIADMDFDGDLGKRTLPIEFGATRSYQISALSLLGTSLIAGLISLTLFNSGSIAFLVLVVLYLIMSLRVWVARQNEAVSHATNLKYVLFLSLVVWSAWVGANVVV